MYFANGLEIASDVDKIAPTKYRVETLNPGLMTQLIDYLYDVCWHLKVIAQN